MKNLKFSAYAREDLLAILKYIARDNPTRAKSFVAELRGKCELLAQFPSTGVAKPEYAEGLRMLVYEKYLIFFSNQTEEVLLIERVLHSARNLSDILSLKTYR